MSTVVQFTPTSTSAFRFSPVINGVQYTAIITWNAFGQRYYLNLFDTSGNLVLVRPVVSSGPRVAVALTWLNNGFGGIATAVTAAPHNVPIGTLAKIYISQTDSPYDGLWLALATGPSAFTWTMTNPKQGQTTAGELSFIVNLVQALGAGWLIFRYVTSTFEYESTTT